MRGAAFAAGVAALAALLASGGGGRASLYSPDDPFAVPVGTDGRPAPLPFDEFKRRLAVLTNALVEPKPGEKPNPDRVKFLDRIAKQEKGPKRTAPEAAALATDLLRVGQSDRALGVLGPHAADRRPDYFVFTGLASAHAARGEWADALRYHQEGQFDTKMPETVKGLSKGQRDWWARLDADVVPRFYQIRRQETEERRGLGPTERHAADETEDVLPLLPLSGEPVRFVNAAGEYEAGVLAPAEQAKLPPDALATAQQLVLWFPGDTRLYWLLAELYAAAGDVRSAVAILDECTWGRQYGNRKVLVAHRHALRAAADALDRVEPIEGPAFGLGTIGVYFGVVGVLAALALVRTVLKRR
ncbi:hypothetical protein [Gemmata sp.]|uniref:hypothetical protein n=1 Tax=Gemmata sp. TaxID=1914242 RepID=UPI003F7302A1